MSPLVGLRETVQRRGRVAAVVWMAAVVALAAADVTAAADAEPRLTTWDGRHGIEAIDANAFFDRTLREVEAAVGFGAADPAEAAAEVWGYFQVLDEPHGLVPGQRSPAGRFGRLFLGTYDCRYRFHRVTLEPLEARTDTEVP